MYKTGLPTAMMMVVRNKGHTASGGTVFAGGDGPHATNDIILVSTPKDEQVKPS